MRTVFMKRLVRPQQLWRNLLVRLITQLYSYVEMTIAVYPPRLCGVPCLTKLPYAHVWLMLGARLW